MAADGGAERCRLYLVTPPMLQPVAFAEKLRSALDGGDVACLQLRLADADDDEVRRAAEPLMRLTQEYNVAFLLNGRPDLALELRADGCHLDPEDTAHGLARTILGPDRIVGVACGVSRHLAMEAAEAGADYVAFEADVEILRWWSGLFEAPCVASGDIGMENCSSLVAAGADFLMPAAAVVWQYSKGPGAAVRALNKAMAETSREARAETT